MRCISLLLAFPVFVVAPCMSQSGQGEWDLIPAVSRDDVKVLATHGIGTDGRHVITWIGGSTKGAPIRFDVYERVGMKHVKTVNTEWPASNHYIERWIDWNGGTYLITVDNDPKAERVDIKAQRYKLPDLTTDGEPITIGSLAVSDFNTSFWGVGLRFEQSPDGGKLLVLFDRLVDKKGKQVAACWVFDGSWSPVQQATFELLAISDAGTGTRAAMVDDAGVVHLLISAKYDGPDGKKGAMGHKVFRLEGGAARSVALASPAGGEVTSAGMVRNGDQLILAGFYSTKDKKGGRFHATQAADLSGSHDLTLDPFSDASKEYTRAQVIVRSDGGYFLVGNACTPTGLDLAQHKELSVNAYGADGAREWNSNIPRAVGYTKYDNQGFLAVERVGTLTLLMPDPPDNVANYNAGKDPKGSDSAQKTILVRFDQAGKPSFELFGAPAYTMLYQGISLLPDGHTVFQHAAPAGSKMDRNQAYAFVDLSK